MLHADLSRARWRKSSRSGGNNGQCVEVALNLADVAAVRDSKDPHEAALTFGKSQFAAFVAQVKEGQLDR